MACDHHTFADFVWVHWGWSLVAFVFVGMSLCEAIGNIGNRSRD